MSDIKCRLIIGLPRTASTFLIQLFEQIKEVNAKYEGHLITGDYFDSLYDSIDKGTEEWFRNIIYRKNNWFTSERFIKTVDKKNLIETKIFEHQKKKFVDDIATHAILRMMAKDAALNGKYISIDKTPINVSSHIYRVVPFIENFDFKVVFTIREFTSWLYSMANLHYGIKNEPGFISNTSLFTDDDYILFNKFQEIGSDFISKETSDRLSNLFTSAAIIAEELRVKYPNNFRIYSFDEITRESEKTFKEIADFFECNLSRYNVEHLVSKIANKEKKKKRELLEIK